jgi:cytochrome c biogenesis protein CcdA
MELEEEFLPALKERYKDRLIWKELETSQNPENLSFLLAASKRFNRTNVLVPAVLVGDTFLVGREEIKGKLIASIEATLSHKPKPFEFTRVDLLMVFKRLSVFTVIGAGLIDGINPCAFAVVVFFVSFLGVYGYRKREIIYVGSSYCLAVFITYVLIGLGFFRFLYAIQGFHLLIKGFYYFIAVFCFLLALFALYDYFKFKKTKDSEGLILQLPPFLKKRINLVIGSHLRAKEDRGCLSLSLTSFMVGFFVSVLEAACTGQVYVPTIVFILRNTSLRLKALTYLILYKLMFILPLLSVFVLSLIGFSSQRFNDYLKRNLGAIKLLMASLFLLLGVLILRLS